MIGTEALLILEFGRARIRVESVDHDLAQHVETSLAPFVRRAVPNGIDYTVRIDRVPMSAPREPRGRTCVILPEVRGTTYESGDTRIHIAPGLLVVRASQVKAVVHAAARRSEAPEVVARVVLEILVQLASISGAGPLHASIIPLADDRTVLCIGAPGAGKTTLTVLAMTSGRHPFCSNDRVLAYGDGDTIQAVGVPDTVRIGEQLLHNALLARSMNGDWERKLRERTLPSRHADYGKVALSPLEVASLFETQLVPNARIYAVMSAEIGDDRRRAGVSEIADAHERRSLLTAATQSMSPLRASFLPLVPGGLLPGVASRIAALPWLRIRGDYRDPKLQRTLMRLDISMPPR